MAPAGLGWLVARPIAHRGLHDASAGVIENTRSAVLAAIAARYAIEVDVQITADDEAMVYHDDALGRLTDGDGRLDTMTAAKLRAVSFKATGDHMMTLGELCDLIAGRAGLLVELKSHDDRDDRLSRRVAQVLGRYTGPVAAMSFDPFQIGVLRDIAPALTRGLVAENPPSRRRSGDHASAVGRAVGYLRDLAHARPQFIAYAVNDLPAALPLAAHYMSRMPLITWTVRTPDERRRARKWADQIIFEGWRP